MRLLIVALVCTEVLLTLTLFIFRATRRVLYPGLGFWTTSEGLQALGYLLLALRGVAPDLESVYLANVLFPLAAVIRLDGTRRFFDLPPARRGWYALPVVQLLCLSLSTLVPNAEAFRGGVTSAAVAVPLFAMVAVIWRRSPPERWTFHATVGAAFGILGLILTVRAAVLATMIRSTSYSWLAGTPLEESVFLAILLGHIAAVAGFLMLHSERLGTDLLRAQAGLQANVADLEQALAEVKTLSGLLPICAHCKKVRDDAGYWTQIEVFVRDRSEAEFSHGICPDCARQLYPEFIDD